VLRDATSTKRRIVRTVSGRRSSLNFAFGNFDIEGGFAVSHQYDRSLAIIRPGDPVSVRATTVPEYQAVTAYLLAGLGPYTARQIREDGLAIPFYPSGDAWQATMSGAPDHTVMHYIVEADHRSGERHYADGRLPLDHARIFTHRVTDRRPPSWTEDAVIYQIFVDRFANADGPILMPDDDHEFAGGDLHGITANLDWIAGLGVNCIWLTPVFTCSSYHGYDAVDMLSIDPRFGGEEALRELVESAHGRGIRVLLDLVPNHVSDRHPWFRSAMAGGRERDWFFIDDDGNYLSFFNSKTMPKVNLDDAGAREAMLDVAAFWIESFGVDGYRIDHALGPSESFFAALSERLESISPDVWCFGEVTATPQLCRRYGGVLDGVTDFPFAYGLRELLAGKLTPRDFAEIERESAAAIPPSDFSWVRFFDNHDMARALRHWDDDEETLSRAVDILFSIPGIPSFFYGTEQALSHERSEAQGGLSVGRVPMSFNLDHRLVRHVTEAIDRRSMSGNSQATPMYWEPDGRAWRWGSLEGDLGG
jgi:glycosidase